MIAENPTIAFLRRLGATQAEAKRISQVLDASLATPPDTSRCDQLGIDFADLPMCN